VPQVQLVQLDSSVLQVPLVSSVVQVLQVFKALPERLEQQVLQDRLELEDQQGLLAQQVLLVVVLPVLQVQPDSLGLLGLQGNGDLLVLLVYGDLLVPLVQQDQLDLDTYN
jgi:hypothetical protein